MTPRIQKAIDIFLDAINEGTLAKGTCAACACGNLVANAVGFKINIDDLDRPGCLFPNTEWFRMSPLGDEQIHLTGFTRKEFWAIENAFESNTLISFKEYPTSSKEEIRADQIRGLEAVVKVMLSFDDCKEEVKEVFTNRAELIPL